MDRFHISATSHWPNYLPEYVARDHGYFADEGLDFARVAPTDWTQVLDDLDGGAAEAVLGGIWVPSMYHGRGRDYVAFAQLNATNPKAIVTRQPVDGLAWSDLVGKTVLAPGAGGTAPYTHTAGLMRRAGVDPASVHFVRDLSAGMLTELFVGGMGDAIVLDRVGAALLAAQGNGHIALRIDEVGGPMPNSVYYANRRLLQRADQPAHRFCRALQRAMDWLVEHPAAEVADLLRREWPTLDQRVLIEVVDDFRTSGLWSSVLIDEAAFTTWQEILADEHLIDKPIAYDSLVDSAPGRAATVDR